MAALHVEEGGVRGLHLQCLDTLSNTRTTGAPSPDSGLARTPRHASRVLYDTHDVTSLLQGSGRQSTAGVEHVLGVQVTPGWYAQHTVQAGVPSLLLRLSITYADGSTTSIVSGLDWKAAPGPVVKSDIYKGETFDGRLVQLGWSEPAFDDSKWGPAASVAPPSDTVQVSSNRHDRPCARPTVHGPSTLGVTGRNRH